ncbi:DNA-binding protein [Sporosarcina sp. P21c]|uniref:small multi-drug export protein n=1 Tax=Sporosarcina TaxID=1569 RepID=UPI000A14E19C|nr:MULTISPECIES: small multi-drug export protein [Sporosarcina]ARJ38128.1 DNA-binding protein [Sporosarcina ureae]PIC67060.1 DNA-binding protein [Sporosarcina sp. P16a]PIC83401.1 DNA-binding protein [Sporosarcina sp. P1]PIC89785.1 DNA-binding protein [Sporosarcina sp. P21c]PIC92514.1 DNA-binding protein [Sporosarcina sp. P25]
MLEYILVFLGAAIPWIEIMIVVPLGIIRGLSPIWVIVLSFAGNMATVLLLIVGFQHIKEWMARRKQKKGKGKSESKRQQRAEQIMNKYGLPVLALAGPILIGTHIAAFIGLVLGAKKMNTAIWSAVSIALWCLVFGILTAMGFDFFVNHT